MRMRGGKRTFQDGGVNDLASAMQARGAVPGQGLAGQAAVNAAAQRANLSPQQMQNFFGQQMAGVTGTPQAAPPSAAAAGLQGMFGGAPPAAGARPTAPPGGFTAAGPGAGIGGIGPMNPGAMQQAMMARRGAVGGPLAGGAPGGPVRPPVTGAGAMPGNGALPSGGMFAGAGAPPTGVPPAAPPMASWANIPQGTGAGLMGQMGGAAAPPAGGMLGGLPPGANANQAAALQAAAMQRPQRTPLTTPQPPTPLPGAGIMPPAGLGFAKGGRYEDASKVGIDEDNQLGDKSDKPEAKAKGGKVRTFNSAAAPAENLPTHPGKEKLAKGGVLRRKPLSKAAKEPVPTPAPDDDTPPPMTLAKGGKAGGKWIGSAVKKPGALHKQLGVPAGEKIPAGKLAKAAQAGGKLGQRARLAETLKGMKKNKGGACDKMAAGGAAKQRRGYPNTNPPPKKYADGGKIKGCGVATKGCSFSGIY